MTPAAKAYIEAIAFGLAGAVLAAAIQSVQQQGIGHIDWAVVGAAALSAGLLYLQAALRWLGTPAAPTPVNVVVQPPARPAAVDLPSIVPVAPVTPAPAPEKPPTP